MLLSIWALFMHLLEHPLTVPPCLHGNNLVIIKVTARKSTYEGFYH